MKCSAPVKEGKPSIALWRLKPTDPLGPFKIIDGREQPTNEGTDTLLVFTVSDRSGNEAEIWHRWRENLKCRREWGENSDTDDWGEVMIKPVPRTTRGILVPADPQIQNEEVILE